MNTRSGVDNEGDKAIPAPKQATDDALSALRAEFSAFIADMEALSQKTQAISHEDMTAIREQLTTRIARAKSSLEKSVRSAGNSVQQSAKKIIATTDQHIQKRPFYALGISAIVAAAFGFAVGQRRTGPTKA